MNYRNGKDILPAKLLKELQKYTQGELLYVPRQTARRAGWGEVNGTKSDIMKRNIEIHGMYKDGITVPELANIYHLSEDSIRKVITKVNKMFSHPCSPLRNPMASTSELLLHAVTHPGFLE